MRAGFFPGLVLALCTALAFSAPKAANATSYPEFSIDFDASSINVSTATCSANCGVTAKFTKSGTKSHTFKNEGEIWSLNNLIQWSIKAPVWSVYDITIELLFKSPDEVSSQTDGKGIFWTFSGLLSGNKLWCDDWTKTVAFDQGSELSLWFEDGASIGLGSKLKTDVHLMAKTLVGNSSPSPVPLPAAFPILMAVLGGLWALGTRQRRRSMALS